MTGPAAGDAHPTPEQVAEALSYMRERAGDCAARDIAPWLGSSRTAQRHATTLVRAALAAETESHVEWRVVGTGPSGTRHEHSHPLSECQRKAALWLSTGEWTDVRVESRQVTTSRTETPWKAEQT